MFCQLNGPNGQNGSALTCWNASSCTHIFLSVCLQVFMAEIICPVIEVSIYRFYVCKSNCFFVNFLEWIMTANMKDKWWGSLKILKSNQPSKLSITPQESCHWFKFFFTFRGKRMFLTKNWILWVKMIWGGLLTTLAICQISTFPIFEINHINSNTDTHEEKKMS